MLEAIIKPKKNPQILKGWLSIKYTINLERIKIDVNIPKVKVIKKDPFISFQNDENFNVKSNFNERELNDFIESINSS